MEAPTHCRFLFKRYSKIPSTNSSSQQEKNILRRLMRDASVRVKKSKAVRKAKSVLLRGKVNSREPDDQESHLINHDGLNVPDQLGQKQESDQSHIDHQEKERSNLRNSARLKIYVKIASRAKSIAVEAKGYHIIGDIKSEIRAFEGIEPDEYFLFYGGKRVEDYRTLSSLGVRTESTLHLIFRPESLLPIRVITPAGKVLKFEANALHTVRDVKAVVESFIGCPVADCRAIWAGIELDDAKSLAFYGVEENAVLELQSSWIQIFVKTWSGKTVTLYVRRSSTVREVKEKLFCKVGMPIPRQGIVFSGKRLEDNRTLSAYSVCKDSTLRMVLWH